MADGKKYFLVLGAARGGTTLLGHCLDSHPRILCLREAGDRKLRGKRNAVQAIQRRLAHVPVLGALSALADPLASLWPEPRLPLEGKALPAGLWRARKFHDFVHSRLARANEPVCGDKIITDSVAAMYRLLPVRGAMPDVDRYARIRRERLDFFCNTLFTDYRLIFITRDGRAVVQSKVRREGATRAGAAAAWLASARIHATLQEVAGDRLLTVRFEDLVTQPRVVLARISEFLGEAFHEQMLTGAQRPYDNEVNPGFNLDKVAAPRDETLDALLSEGLLRFGYPVEPKALAQGVKVTAK